MRSEQSQQMTVFHLGGEILPEVKTRYGALSVPDDRSDIIGRFLQHYGEWAWDETHFVALVLPERARVLDVGAFLGTFGLGLSLHRPLRSLCFVEANSTIVPVLQRNIDRNSKVPTIVVEGLVGGGGSATLQGGRATLHNLGSTSFASSASGDVSVGPPAANLTLSQIRAEHGPFDLIKLDTEGMELEILLSDAEFLSRGGTMIWTECNEAPISIEVAELLLSWGLDLYYFAFPSHNPDNVRGATEAIFPLAYEAGLLAAPKLAPALDDTLRRHGCILAPIWSGEDLRRALWRTPRWGMPDWHGAPAEQIAALAGRVLRGDDRANFLTPGWQPGKMLWERIAALEALLADERQRPAEAPALERRLAEASVLALDRLAEIGALKEEAEALRDRLHLAAGEVERLHAEVKRLAAQLEFETVRFRDSETEAARARDAERKRELDRAMDLESKIHDLDLLNSKCRGQLDAILQSATWRLAQQGHRAVAAMPPVHRMLRLARRAAGKIARTMPNSKRSRDI